MEGSHPAIIAFKVFVFLFSVVIHEITHGYVAEKLGDSTARLAGRLTLNPIKHLDLFGSILLPILLILSGTGIVFGWAKPVPFNPANLRDPVRDGAKIALAGPASNFAIAIVFALLLRVVGTVSVPALLPFLFILIVQVNVTLAVFNLVPIPPLDGSKLLPVLLPRTEQGIAILNFLERNGFILILVFVFFGFRLIVPIIHFIFNLLVPASLF